MRELGRKDFIYVADAALITEANLALMDDWNNGFLFVSRLPMTYNECRQAITRAVEAEDWDEIGVISDEPATKNRKPATYRASETMVTLYGTNYRAVVVHSDAHDERRQKKVSKQIEQDRDSLATMKKEVEKIDYACLLDAQAAVERIGPGLFHEIVVQIEPRPTYARGRPKASEARIVKNMRYGLKIELRLDENAAEKARQEAGCFVLITNTLAEGIDSLPAKELLTIYKDQHMVEQNFGFLKDPVFVNALFLKSPRRIEALGLILVLALLIWRLMERTMRLNLTQNQQKITGWEKRQTSRPTSFMMTTKFIGIFVLTSHLGRRVAKPLTPTPIPGYPRTQPRYLHQASRQTKTRETTASKNCSKLIMRGAECGSSITSDENRIYVSVECSYEPQADETAEPETGRPNFFIIDKASLKILKKAQIGAPLTLIVENGQLLACYGDFENERGCKVVDPVTTKAVDVPDKICVKAGEGGDCTVVHFPSDRAESRRFVALTKDYLGACRTYPDRPPF